MTAEPRGTADCAVAAASGLYKSLCVRGLGSGSVSMPVEVVEDLSVCVFGV